ncbi:MAG: chromosome segregation protein SMC [Betaproteobacteria bacterium]|nr:chromosome segregation protein SMC [Betaproteobacteria bacterium]
MRLHQIRLSGFKSFVDPTSIHFPGQLVGIVGPNGCGKSNVIDAVRWVLGETRASALRGDSMQDVIFNGSGNRKPLARASVELMFDNSLGRAGGQWNQYAELSVKRVLQRDGESSYYINNQHVRRRDVTDMFLGTGLGPRAYAIIEQGMISRVIEAKPDELRVFLEEAAGVSRYKERRKETEHRLEDTRSNLARVTDIRMELGAQIEKLEAQAKVATRYQEIQAELQLKQQLLWFLRRRDAAAERERHAQEIAGQANALEAGTATLREVESRLETARAAHYAAGDSMNAAQAALYAANAEVARLESELRHVEETRQRLEFQHAERRTQLGTWREQRAQLTQALHMWAGRAGGARQRVSDAQARATLEGGRLPEAERAFRQAQEQQTECRSQLLRAESRAQLEQSNLEHVERALAALAQRRERLLTERRSLLQPDAAALAAQEARRAAGDAAIVEGEATLTGLQAECDALEAERASAEEHLSVASHEHAAAEAQLATLGQIQAAAEDNAPLRDWLERNDLHALPRLWQQVRIDPGWEVAVESVLRERLHALDVADAARLDAVAADVPPVKAGVLSHGAARGAPALAGYEALAAKVHAATTELGGALSDWLAQAYVCEGAPRAAERERLPAGAVLVNRDGHQFTRYTVAFHAPDPADAGLLARQAEIESLQGKVGELAQSLAGARARSEATVAALAARQTALEAARDALAAQQQARHELQIELLKLQQAEERYRERSGQIDGELALVAQAAGQDEARRAQCSAATQQVGQEIAAARAQLDAVRAAYVAAETALETQRHAVQQAERDAQDAVFGERECSAKIAEIDASVRLIDQQIERADAELGKLTEELAVDPVPEVRGALESAVEVRIEREKALAAARNGVEAAAGALRALEEERLQAEAQLAPLRERIGELRLKEQAAQINRDQFDSQLRDGGADEARLAAQADGAPRPSSLQGEITRLTQALGELGAVNLAALEELRTSLERKEYLDAQALDLEEAVRTMEDAIRRIDRETRELLRETFDSVNRHFGALFPVLFGGGEARLIMTGEEILDAGVQVMAHPPGKRNTSIHLLSGGEKALTAIALVFSMFQLNPAPFCLLDEVDAPLDDSNTERFCSLVRKMSAQTQFLFISHNKITMEMAAQLIGVTMPESGVSRVVAVDIDEALRIREELAA